jgi:hypothetical protein
MSLYNIVNPTSMQPGQPEDISQVLANFQAIQTILNGGIDDANIRATAAIALSKLAGYPADATKFPRGDGAWALPGVIAVYRKVTPKVVVNSIAEADLLNGEITVAGGLMGLNGGIRLTAFGDSINNSGVAQKAPNWKLKLGATTLIDTGTMVTTTSWATTPVRWGWRVQVEIMNLGTANSQAVKCNVFHDGSLTNGQNSFTTGEGIYSAATQTGLATALGYVTGAVDTTVAQVLALSMILPAASANLDMTLKAAIVEIM